MRWMILAAVLACGKESKPFVQETAIGAACDPTGTSEHLPDCAAPMLCTDAFMVGGDSCMRVASSGCDVGQDTYSTPSGLVVCLPKCGVCAVGWACTSGVCVPPH